MDVLSRTPPDADHRLPYGVLPLQFGDLWLPHAAKNAPAGAKFPVVVFVHGGWWQAQYDLAYTGFLAAALKRMGVAVWSLEYRRVGNGGGWPGTFADVAAGCDFLVTLAKSYPLDLSRVVTAGHSAGGHLALWLAGRHHIPEASPIHAPQPVVPLSGVVSLAGAVDLRLTIDLGGLLRFRSGKPATENLMGGSPAAFPERYAAGNPGELLPLHVPQWLLQGAEDDQIPPTLPTRYADSALRQGDMVTVTSIPNADHFDVVDPESEAWPIVAHAFRNSLRLS